VPEPVRAVRTLTVGSGSAQGTLEYAAEIRARTESRLGFRVGGKMTRRWVEVGQAVRAGQLLAELDPEDLQLGRQAAAAALRAAQVQADQAAADLQRFRELQQQGFISAAELERRESTLQAAQAQLEQARAQAGVQGNLASYSRLLASADGVVTAVEAEPGAVLAAGTPVLRLAHRGPRDAVFAVPEDGVASARALLGRPGAVSVTLWGQSEALPATVREVAAAAEPATRTFLVKAGLGAASVQLGQTAVVRVTQPVQEGVVRLPLPALMAHQGGTAVWVVDPASMTVRAQPVVVAGAEGNTALVAQGLQPGQQVVTAGVHVLTPGQKVRFFEAPPPGASPVSAAASR
jgi:RND family efflux transporter MFP subunit